MNINFMDCPEIKGKLTDVVEEQAKCIYFMH